MKRKIVFKTKSKKMSISPAANRYEKDFSKWTEDQAEFLRKGEFKQLDIDNLIEEIRDLGKPEKQIWKTYLMHNLKLNINQKNVLILGRTLSK